MPAPTRYDWDPTTGILTATTYARIMQCRVGMTYPSRKPGMSAARVAAIFMTADQPRVEIVRDGPRGQGCIRAASFFNSYVVGAQRVEKKPKPAKASTGVTVEAVALVDMRDTLEEIRALLARLLEVWELPASLAAAKVQSHTNGVAP